jgi:ppGpp synthetase/RelA/SpoT-type nucleotidyltranferase
MGRKKNEGEEDNKYKKVPRSSRICLRCTHKYSSHIDVKCLKITQRKPERKECDCKGFISNLHELQFEIDTLERKIENSEDEAKITLFRHRIKEVEEVIERNKSLKAID